MYAVRVFYKRAPSKCVEVWQHPPEVNPDGCNRLSYIRNVRWDSFAIKNIFGMKGSFYIQTLRTSSGDCMWKNWVPLRTRPESKNWVLTLLDPLIAPVYFFVVANILNLVIFKSSDHPLKINLYASLFIHLSYNFIEPPLITYKRPRQLHWSYLQNLFWW